MGSLYSRGLREDNRISNKSNGNKLEYYKIFQDLKKCKFLYLKLLLDGRNMLFVYEEKVYIVYYEIIMERQVKILQFLETEG